MVCPQGPSTGSAGASCSARVCGSFCQVSSELLGGRRECHAVTPGGTADFTTQVSKVHGSCVTVASHASRWPQEGLLNCEESCLSHGHSVKQMHRKPLHQPWCWSQRLRSDCSVMWLLWGRGAGFPLKPFREPSNRHINPEPRVEN